MDLKASKITFWKMTSSGKVKFGIASKDTTSSRSNSSSSGGVGGGAGAGIGYSATFYHTQTPALKGNSKSNKRGDLDEEKNNFVENLL